jgi:hypothetical protein
VTVGPKFVGPTFHFQGGQTFCPPWDFDLDHMIQGRKRIAVKVPLGINVQVELSLELNMDGLNVKAEQILQVQLSLQNGGHTQRSTHGQVCYTYKCLWFIINSLPL